VRIDLPESVNIKSVKSRSKPDWYTIRHDKKRIILHINNREVEMLDIESE